MDIHEQVLDAILSEPGTSKSDLSSRFDLNDYRLKRILRHINKGLSESTILNDDRNGVWLVRVDPEKCGGMVWHGARLGGYLQCSRVPELPDGCCYRHSDWENPEMIAFERRLRHATGPCEPTARHLTHLSLTEIEDLARGLKEIVAMTLKELQRRKRFLAILGSAASFLRWKAMMAERHDRESWIPPEFAERHRRSSGNSFEFTLKKHFVVLEVPPDSSREDVLKAWRRLARRYHPDVQIGGDEEMMKIINLAKERIFRMRGWDREDRK
jgi:DnaJ-domain-containing protein 1